MFKRYSLYALILAVVITSIVIVFPPVARVLGVKTQFKISQGLDLVGGTQLVYSTDLANVAPGDQEGAVDSLVEVIRRRVDNLGVAEPTIQKTRDNDRVIVELPGVKDIDQALSLIGQTAQLEFREGIEGKSLTDGQFSSGEYEDWQPVGLDGAHFTRARVDFDQSQASVVPKPVITIQFDETGRQIFADVTESNINKPLAIFLDKELLSAPTVQARIDSDTAQITGSFDLTSAKQLADQLNAGALPVPISIISQNNIGATLGAESVNKSILAGLIGLLLVILFMVVYYRLPGVLASVALICYALITMALFMGIHVTLTLAGIAGFILSIGMAIDANILIFERMREELRTGVPLRAAIDAGFRRAWSSIKDSNISSLITALILYYFGSSLIRGFALTLGIGILVSMFTAMTITHVMLKWAASSRLKDKLNWWAPGLTQK